MKEIRKIIRAYDQWRQQNLAMALATVVKVEESSYRRIGARMLVTDVGPFIGGISGGCLEGDALKKAKLAIHSKSSSKVVYDTLEDDDYQIGVGLGCNGRIEILFTPIDQEDPHNPIELLRQTIEANRPAILLKVIAAESASLLGQSKLLIDDLTNISFAHFEPAALDAAVANVMSRKKPKVLLQDDGASEVLVEYLRPETRLIIVGNNYDVNAMIGIAKELGWQVSVMARKAKVLKSISQAVDKVYDYDEVTSIPQDEHTAVILMTHDYHWDMKMVPHFISGRIAYLGMLGPRKRFDKMNAELLDNGFETDLESVMHLHAPTGLDIGAESPEEISLSIAAEILSVFRQRNGQRLKQREGTIHEREPLQI